MRRRHPFALLLLLLITSLVAAQFGFLIRNTVGKNVGQLQEGPALAVPFTLLRDPTLLLAAGPLEGTETLSKPGLQPPAVPEREPVETQPPPGAPADSPPEQAEGQAGEIGPVEEAWFDDALFIGDSRTVGMSQYGRLGKADYFADTGMTVFNVLTREAADTGFARQRLESLLSAKEYGKIYLMLGINEIGYPFETLIRQYQAVLDSIRAMQPGADVLLCANLHVTRAAAAATPRLEPDHIEQLDEAVAALADGTSVFFLDANPVFCDADGYLREELTGDGVHPYGTGYETWAQWLMEHGIT